MSNKEKFSPKEKVETEVEINLGKEEVAKLEFFRKSCERCIPQIEAVLPSKSSEGPIEDFLDDQWRFLDSLEGISKQMLESFKQSTEFRVVPMLSARSRDMLLFFEPGMKVASDIESDADWKKFDFLFYYLYDDDEEKAETIKENLRDGKTVILKYDKNKD